MDLRTLRASGHLVLECVSGSRAYGLQTPQSDTDLKGVYIAPRKAFYGLSYPEQLDNGSADETYYELNRYVELLASNNPNLLELLASPPDTVRLRHPLMERLRPDLFLSKLCEKSFSGYAMTQIRKARGLNKKIHNPMEKERKGVLDFCYVAVGQGAVPVRQFLEERGLKQEHCGLNRITHMPEVFGLFYGEEYGFSGILRSPKANEVALNSIPKGLEPIAYLSFNKSGYSQYCRRYKEYWEWVEKRNDTRYQSTLEHGKNYDAKNMMHTFRLLHMAEEIGREGCIHVRRPDREFLLQIRSGEFTYDDLVKRAEDLVARIGEVYASSDLPEKPDMEKVNGILVEMREEFYGSKL